MKAVGIVPSPSAVSIVVIESGLNGTLTAPFREEWKLSEDDRPSAYVELRKRILERVANWKPDFVCIEPLEPLALKLGKPKTSWFQTAEVRGVVAEACQATGTPTSFRSKSIVTETIGARKAAEYADDNAF